jgi:hypothetical protein
MGEGQTMQQIWFVLLKLTMNQDVSSHLDIP